MYLHAGYIIVSCMSPFSKPSTRYHARSLGWVAFGVMLEASKVLIFMVGLGIVKNAGAFPCSGLGLRVKG